MTTVQALEINTVQKTAFVTFLKEISKSHSLGTVSEEQVCQEVFNYLEKNFQQILNTLTKKFQFSSMIIKKKDKAE